MFKEFKAFAMRGNVLDLAVAVILGGAFGKIVTSLVNDILMPPIGLLVGRMDFSALFINLANTAYPTLAAAKAAGAPTLNYGVFINTLIDFLIVALAIFLVVRLVTRLHRVPATALVTKPCPYCLSPIPLRATRCLYCTSEVEAV